MTQLSLFWLIKLCQQSMKMERYQEYFDLSKAFDTVNHKILSMKMYKCGIRGVALSWFERYLSNRNQYVSFSNHSSESMFISCGVPQGSMLGPLLFLLYANDTANVSYILSPEASFGIRVLSLPASVCVCVRACVSLSVCQLRVCLCDNSSPVQTGITKFGTQIG